MGFEHAFLGAASDLPEEALIALQVDRLLQAVVPEPVVPNSLKALRSASICFGVPMNWALSDADRIDQIRAALTDRITRFEPRLANVFTVEINEDDQGNVVEFFIRARLRAAPMAEPVEIETRVSLMDQTVEDATP